MKYLHVMKYTALALAAGVIFVACASNDHETASYEYEESYSTSEASGAQPSTRTEVVSTKGTTASSASSTQYSQDRSQASTQRQSTSQATQVEGDQWVIPLHEERVSVGKRTVDSGQVTIRKIVTTETINQPIQLRRETLVIDRQGGAMASSQGTSGQSVDEPAGAQPASATQSSDTQPFQEQTFTIQLREEQPVVEKNVVQTGRVVAKKNSEMQQQTVSREVRREDVQIDRSGAGQNVQITGQEASGAERTVQPAAQPVQQKETIEYKEEVDVSDDEDGLRDPNTLDEINRGNNTRGGAEDLIDFDEKAPKD